MTQKYTFILFLNQIYSSVNCNVYQPAALARDESISASQYIHFSNSKIKQENSLTKMQGEVKRENAITQRFGEQNSKLFEKSFFVLKFSFSGNQTCVPNVSCLFCCNQTYNHAYQSGIQCHA